MNRRTFLQKSLATGASLAAAGSLSRIAKADGPARRQPSRLFKISLAEWSFHRALGAGTMNHLDFPRVAQLDYGIHGIELVNQFFKDKAKDRKYLGQFKRRADDLNVRCLLIMIDGEGALGDPDAKARKKAVENHYKWVEAAQFLGCHSIRVNAETNNAGTREEQAQRATEGLRCLGEFGEKHGLNVIVENHGHLSSDGQWLSGVMRAVGLRNVGTLPDFGNFQIDEKTVYDRYAGIQEMMPYAKAVSAKSNEFDDLGNEAHMDYRRIMRIVLDAGYRGWVGIEYEGDRLSESEGVMHTKWLLEQIRTELEPHYA